MPVAEGSHAQELGSVSKVCRSCVFLRDTASADNCLCRFKFVRHAGSISRGVILTPGVCLVLLYCPATESTHVCAVQRQREESCHGIAFSIIEVHG